MGLLDKMIMEGEDPATVAEKYFEIVAHAYYCHDVNCLHPNCKELKVPIKRVRSCKMNATGDCRYCRKYRMMSFLHSKHCLETNCTVSFCRKIKLILEQLAKNATYVKQSRLLLHVFRCYEANCSNPWCERMLRVTKHKRICKLKITHCLTCAQLIPWYLHHTKRCPRVSCPVTFCTSIKKKLKHFGVLLSTSGKKKTDLKKLKLTPAVSIKRCFESLHWLMHAWECRAAVPPCRLLSCKTMKLVIQHINTCKRTYVDCRLCKKVIAFCVYHMVWCKMMDVMLKPKEQLNFYVRRTGKFYRYKILKWKKKGQCLICKKLVVLCRHVRHCQEKTCVVPFCNNTGKTATVVRVKNV